MTERDQEKYDKTTKRLKIINHFGESEPFDDKTAIVYLTDEVDYYRRKIEWYNDRMDKLASENEVLKKVIVKLAIQMFGADK